MPAGPRVKPADTLTRNQRIVSWICCLIAAAIMIETLFFKFTGAAESVYIFQADGHRAVVAVGAGHLGTSGGHLPVGCRALRWAGGTLTDRCDARGDPEPHDLVGLLDSGRPRPSFLHGAGDLRLRIHGDAAASPRNSIRHAAFLLVSGICASTSNHDLIAALKKHWPEYLMEAAELGIFMVSACLFTILLYHPASPAVRAIPPEIHPSRADGAGHGADSGGHRLFALGQTVGSAHEPRLHVDVLSAGQGRTLGCGVLYRRAVCWRGGGSRLVAAFAGRVLSTPAGRIMQRPFPGQSGTVVAFFGETLISFILLWSCWLFQIRRRSLDTLVCSPAFAWLLSLFLSHPYPA